MSDQGTAAAAPGGAVALSRRRPHTSIAWMKIRSSIQYYYIDLDMTLQDVKHRVEQEHNFHATDQMYKKRLKAWGLTKQVKTEEKEKALTSILQDKPVPVDSNPIRPDKLVRYAKSRVKSGAIDSHHLSKMIRRDRPCNDERPLLYPFPLRPASTTLCHGSGAKAAYVPRSPALPAWFADFDVFLRAMQVMIDKEREEWLSGRENAPDAIFGAVAKGLACWRKNYFAAAKRSFGKAAQRIIEDLHRNVVSVSRIAYCVSSILWGIEREPVLQKFSEFMANAALEVLGQRCPLTIVLVYVQRESSVDAQIRIWECALDSNQLSEQNVYHWWNMAQRRWRLCYRGERRDLAVDYCRQAVVNVRRIGKMTSEMELETQQELEMMLSPER